jgi:preprotein translocase subunit SecB
MFAAVFAKARPRARPDGSRSQDLREGVGMSTTNGGPAASTAQNSLPQLSVVAQYIKDLSFENPNAPRSLMASKEQPQISIQINVNAAPTADGDVEVVLKLDGKAETAGMLMFGFELIFAGVFRIRNVPQESMNAVLMIECPRLLFPFAREIVANTVRNGGFPPLLLDPVDFTSLYRQRMGEMAANQATSQS